MLSTVPAYPSDRIATKASPYFLGNNYLPTAEYGPQHECAAYSTNQTSCEDVAACAYDTVEFECVRSATPRVPDDLFSYPTPPIIATNYSNSGNTGGTDIDISGSGSGGDDDDDDLFFKEEDLGEAERALYDGEAADESISATMIIVCVVGCIVGLLIIVLVVAFAVVKAREVQKRQRDKRKSSPTTATEQEKMEMKERKRREKEEAKLAKKQAKQDAKKQKQQEQQQRKERRQEIELEERDAVPMSVAAYFAEAGDILPAPSVMLLSELGAPGMLGATHKAKITSHTSDGLVAAKLVHHSLLASPHEFAEETRRLCSFDSPLLVQTLAYSDPQDVSSTGPSPNFETPMLRQGGSSSLTGSSDGGSVVPGTGEDVTTGRGNKCPWDCVMVISEYVQAPNMRNFVWSCRPDQRPLLKLRMCMDIARGLKYLHENGALHRDLKPENVLVVGSDPDADVVCRLCGFATAGLRVKETVMDFANGIGTPQYLAPELMSGEEEDFTQMADVYSFGVVAFEAFREEAVYSENRFESNFALMRYVLSGKRPAPNEKVTQDCATDTMNLLAACWDQDPSLRPDLTSVITQLENCAKNIII